ncbi:DsbA family protein [Methylocaldum sp. GT1TLB]|uniref:DsbA family protein n=1 Tax=unclassified Methylocaldum TaxID=2622260 RepID=UPI003DA0DFAF
MLHNRPKAAGPALLYFHDPMCSWCWAFRPVWQSVRTRLPDAVEIEQFLGGLAPDSAVPMPAEMRENIQDIWRTIERSVPGTRFNFDFWTKCVPRRSTYPACRAVIAARRQGAGFEDAMIFAIQQAYYLQARNPSNDSTLIELAEEIGLDRGRFAADLRHPDTHVELLEEIRWARELGVRSFPTLLLSHDEGYSEMPVDYGDANRILSAIAARL